jgi:predicted RNA binding protein YcfA (HicA-like mRNA interferase family)
MEGIADQVKVRNRVRSYPPRSRTGTAMNKRKLLQKILAGSKNIRFADFAALVEAFGFSHIRTSGSHQIFEHPDVEELINLQNKSGKAKPYQIKQFLELVELYNLELGDE